MENTELYESREQAPWNHNGTEEIVDNYPEQDGEEEVGCPMCGGYEAVAMGRLGVRPWVRCRSCGTVYQGEDGPEED